MQQKAPSRRVYMPEFQGAHRIFGYVDARTRTARQRAEVPQGPRRQAQISV